MNSNVKTNNAKSVALQPFTNASQDRATSESADEVIVAKATSTHSFQAAAAATMTLPADGRPPLFKRPQHLQQRLQTGQGDAGWEATPATAAATRHGENKYRLF